MRILPRRLREAGPGDLVPRLFILAAALLIPWTVWLAMTLPDRAESDTYRLTWVGFDALLILVLARVGWMAHRRNPELVIGSAVAGGMLICDAWFDVTTAAEGAPFTQAMIAALLLELPASFLCVRLARWGLHRLVERAQLAAALVEHEAVDHAVLAEAAAQVAGSDADPVLPLPDATAP